ncbi:MAG: aminotransferase class I/II-fold pyridoxal phosphate-dependent enzyme [Patescibacteria group bacterium]
MITASLSPNTESNDIFTAIRTLMMPWAWGNGTSGERVVHWFQSRYVVDTVSLFSSGRMALMGILSSFDVGDGDEVLVQAFTCVAVPNSVLWVHAKPVYVDIDPSGNIDCTDAKKKVTSKTKAIIVQHTFGIAANMEAIVSFAKKYHLILIEDCAHSLGVSIKGKLLGTYGDAAFFSFGRDKVISSVWGGVAIIKNNKPKESHALYAFEKSLSKSSLVWIAKQLLHPLVFAISMPFYRIGIGKALIAFFKAIGMITLPIYPTEYTGGLPIELSTQYPNALASLICIQLSKLDRYKKMRDETSHVYITYVENSKKVHTFDTPFGGTYLRFPLLVSDPAIVARAAIKEGILLGNWYTRVIDPRGVSFDSVYYIQGSCPHAEEIAKHILNLPTRLTKSERDRVCSFLSRYV